MSPPRRASSASSICFLTPGLSANDEVENLSLLKFFFVLHFVSYYYSGCYTGSGTFVSSSLVSLGASAPASAGFSPSAGFSAVASPSAAGFSPSFASCLGGGVGVIGEAFTGIFSSSYHS